ncbi:MAG: HD domain-containing protein [Acidimicrobiaceae bacterium]|nr:HD domain-containing protein [Acidimicrobiaceae bacterium]
MNDPSEVERLAEHIARRAHDGQTDKAGHPYIEHPARVAARLTDPELRAAAWLHDVVEDTDWTADRLLEAGMPDRVVETVVAVTRLPGQDDDAYYAQVAASGEGTAVKQADIADNADPNRLALLDPATRAGLEAKYTKALQAIAAHREGPTHSPR